MKLNEEEIMSLFVMLASDFLSYFIMILGDSEPTM
jgi:hypothetical protein